jgi:hypothetical protein
MRTDKELLDWLENEANGVGLIHDDNKHWAVCFNGFQPVVQGGAPPEDFATTYLVDNGAWRPTLREAIDAAIDAESEGEEQK